MRVNGKDASLYYGAGGRHRTYVPQADHLHGTLTVRESLTFASKLRYVPHPEALVLADGAVQLLWCTVGASHRCHLTLIKLDSVPRCFQILLE